MELPALYLLLDRIDGAEYATIDSTTHPRPSIRKITTGTKVILFKGVLGYEQTVRRRLIEAGRNPDNFSLGDLPWGERVSDTPLIVHRGVYYLQTIVLDPGQSVSYLGNQQIDIEDFVPRRRTNQGLSPEDEVVVATYRLDHIDRIALMGEILVASPKGLLPLGT